MLQSERLQKALRQFHFRRWEAQIRSELGNLLRILPEAIQFVEWDHHDLMLEQVKMYRVEAGAGRYPTAEIEWSVDERDTVQETIMSLADKIGDNPTCLYIPQYIASFVPYKGWETCEVPMIQMGSARSIFENALDLMDHIGYFEIVFDEGKEIISLDKSSLIEYESALDRPVQRVLYHIKGWGSAVAAWLSRCKTA